MILYALEFSMVKALKTFPINIAFKLFLSFHYHLSLFGSWRHLLQHWHNDPFCLVAPIFQDKLFFVLVFQPWVRSIVNTGYLRPIVQFSICANLPASEYSSMVIGEVKQCLQCKQRREEKKPGKWRTGEKKVVELFFNLAMDLQQNLWSKEMEKNYGIQKLGVAKSETLPVVGG